MADSAPSSLGHYPDGDKWKFDDGVTRVFDDMLERSIPQYRVMRDLVTDIGARFVRHGAIVVDLGCSRGEAIARLRERTRQIDARYIGVEVSRPMLEAARARFRGDASVEIRELDLRTGYPPEAARLTLCVLTLMFTPIQYRLRIAQDIAQHTMPGGALLLVEKVLGATADIDALLVDRYHSLKHEMGYSWDEIDRKALALEGVQVPVTAEWNEDLLRRAGFSQVDCVWRWGNFASWLALR